MGQTLGFYIYELFSNSDYTYGYIQKEGNFGTGYVSFFQSFFMTDIIFSDLPLKKI